MHYKSICDAILSRIRATINSETFLNQFKEPNRFTRKRLISMYLLTSRKITTQTKTTEPVL